MSDRQPKRGRFDPRNPKSYVGYRNYLRAEDDEDVPVPRRTLYRDHRSGNINEGNMDHQPPPVNAPEAEALLADPYDSDESILDSVPSNASHQNDTPDSANSEEMETSDPGLNTDEESMSDRSTPISNASHLDQESSQDEDDVESNHDASSSSGEETVINDANQKREKMFQNYDLNGTVTPNVTLSRFAVLVMIIHFVMRFKLSDVCLEALIEMINVILGAVVLPPSKFLFRQVFASDTRRKFYLYCSACLNLLGESTKCELNACPSCNEPVDPKTLNKGNFCVHISIADQIRDRLERPGGEAMLSFRQERAKDENYISDTFDAVNFKNIESNITDNSSFLTIGMSVDGANVAISNNKSIWPIQWFINEIPPEERFQPYNIMCGGLWFGRSKITMVTYMSFIVEELNKLAKDGIKWFSSLSNKEVVTKVFCNFFSADTPARAKVMNMIYFNGKNSCHLCNHSGDRVGPKQVRYGYRPTYIIRKDQEIREAMEQAQNSGIVEKGMKGLSPLCYFPNFKFPHAVVVDYMHNQLLGVCKYLVEKIWTNPEYEDRDFYLDNQKKFKINKRILALRPPSNISRDPRPFTNYPLWKANEWRSWLFFYGPIVLKGILPTKYYNHFCLLSSGIFFFCQEKIDRSRITLFGDFLTQFVKLFDEFYGTSRMTFNVHLTVHIKEIVTSCGPLWCYSAFPFEGGNRFLLDLIQCAHGVQQQIVVRYCMYTSLPKLLAAHPELSVVVQDFCEFILSARRLKSADQCADITIKGNKFAEVFVPSEEERTAIVQELPHIDVNDLFLIKKIIYRRQVFAPDMKYTKRDNSFVVLNDGSCVKILNFFLSSENDEKLYLIGKKLNFEDNCGPIFGTPHFHIKVCQAYPFGNQYLVVAADTIRDKCFFMTLKSEDGNDLSFMSPLPNRYEKD